MELTQIIAGLEPLQRSPHSFCGHLLETELLCALQAGPAHSGAKIFILEKILERLYDSRTVIEINNDGGLASDFMHDRDIVQQTRCARSERLGGGAPERFFPAWEGVRKSLAIKDRQPFEIEPTENAHVAL